MQLTFRHALCYLMHFSLCALAIDVVIDTGDVGGIATPPSVPQASGDNDTAPWQGSGGNDSVDDVSPPVQKQPDRVEYTSTVRTPATLPARVRKRYGLERLLKLEVRACVAARRANRSAQRNSLFSTIYQTLPAVAAVDWCARIDTDKAEGDLAEARRSTTQFEPVLVARWNRIGSPYFCRITFKGYVGTYQLSPDMGDYAHCNRDLAAHRHWLGDGSSGALAGKDYLVANDRCPIKSLPSSYDNYLECTLKQGQWYRLEVQSNIFVEKRVNGTYYNWWLNHTDVRHFMPHALTGTDDAYWAERLVRAEFVCSGCECSGLLTKRRDWRRPVNVTVYYEPATVGHLLANYYSEPLAAAAYQQRLASSLRAGSADKLVPLAWAELSERAPWHLLHVRLSRSHNASAPAIVCTSIGDMETGEPLAQRPQCQRLPDAVCQPPKGTAADLYTTSASTVAACLALAILMTGKH